MIKTIAAVLPVAALAFAATVAVAPQASAAYVCGSNQMCVYENANFTGTARVLDPLASYADFRNLAYANGDNVNDSISSVQKNTNRCAGFYNDVNYSGTVAYMGYGWFGQNVSYLMNDRYSSMATWAC
ncbi:peptidase inhibitor family I36 protein [Streptomyces sp. NPDC026673]|uniref:peptidase inhibitor family I36 protein n=1 Tax=Streptomyces sp. NPDC026673 TaxID=3155724 RepID=UPI00340A4916